MNILMFIWYTEADRQLGRALKNHLMPQADGLEMRTVEDLVCGADGSAADNWVGRAQVIVALLSPSFLSEYRKSPAMSRAFRRRRERRCTIVPVRAREVHIPEEFAGIQGLPRTNAWVFSAGNRDALWREIAEQLCVTAQDWHKRVVEPVTPMEAVPEQERALTRSAPEEPRFKARYQAEIKDGAEAVALTPGGPAVQLMSAPRDMVHDLSTGLERLGRLFDKLRVTHSLEEDIMGEISTIQEALFGEGRAAAGHVVGSRFHLLSREAASDRLYRWSGWDRRDECLVTIDLLTHDLVVDEPCRMAIFRRAHGVAAIHHSALSAVVPEGISEGLRLIATELPDGNDLHEMVVRRAVRPDHAVGLVFHLGQGLAALHRAGLVHGNVQPHSVRWTKNGGARLGDWNPLVHVLLPAGSTPPRSAYVAPELRDRIDWQARATTSSDSYALAMLAVFVYHGAELGSNVEGVLAGLPCKPAVREVLRRATSVDPSQRYASVDEMCRALAGADARTHAMSSMLDISGAEFSRGASVGDVQARTQEKPAHRVRVDDFALGRHPVTQELYEVVMSTNPSADPQGKSLPVTNVSFLDAIDFCNRLSLLEGLQPAYVIEHNAVTWNHRADGYRLPTEAEWEYAARDKDERVYPWGDKPPPGHQLVWNGIDSERGEGNRKGPAPIGGHPRGQSPFGAEDMTGNVWEWCWDYYAPYPQGPSPGSSAAPLHNPTGPTKSAKPNVPWPELIAGSAYRILRGGAWNIQNPTYLRAGMRSADDETVRDPDIGFRLAWGPLSTTTPVEIVPEDTAEIDA